MHVSSVYLLRQAPGLDEPGTPVKVIEPCQMLGEIKPDLLGALGVDVVSLGGTTTLFGFKNEGGKPWATFPGFFAGGALHISSTLLGGNSVEGGLPVYRSDEQGVVVVITGGVQVGAPRYDGLQAITVISTTASPLKRSMTTVVRTGWISTWPKKDS